MSMRNVKRTAIFIAESMAFAMLFVVMLYAAFEIVTFGGDILDFSILIVIWLGYGSVFMYAFGEYQRHWFLVDDAERTACCHAHPDGYGFATRCPVCGSVNPETYDSESNDAVGGESSG
jgi:hypothetical protein